MFAWTHHRGWHHGVLVVAGAALFFVNLGGATLWDLDEGKNSTCTLEMWESGNWIVPTFNSELRVDKPALLYWLQLLAYHFFGVNEFAARLPSALAAVVAMLLCYELGRSMFGKATGFLAGLMVGTTPMLCGAARFANPDALLNCLVVLVMLLFWLGQDRPAWWWFPALGVASGLAVLAKGPVGVVLPAAIGFAYCIWNGQARLLLRPGWIGGTLIFLLVAVPWYAWVAAETKAKFLEGFLLNHNVNRFLGTMENHHGSPLYYLIVLLVMTAPWSIFCGLALWYAFWSSRQAPGQRWLTWWQASHDEDSTAAYRLLLTWLTIFLVFFSLAATKLPNYILPVSVPMALLTGRFLVRWSRGQISPPWWVLSVSMGFLLLIGVGTTVGLAIAGGLWPVSFLRGRTFPGVEQGAVLGLIPVAGALLGWWFLRRENRRGLVLTMTLMALGFMAPLAAWGNAVWNDFKSPRPLVDVTRTCQPDQDLRIGCWQLEHLPSLNFYCRRDVVHFKTELEIQPFLRYPIPVYVFVPVKEWDEVRPSLTVPWRELARHHDLYRNFDIVVVTNR